MSFQLRPYQQKFNLNLAKAVAQAKKVIACLPTGAGKSKCFISISHNALAKGRTVLIISETRKIFEQIQNEAEGIEIKAGDKSLIYIKPNLIYVAMAQTLSRRPQLIQQFDYLKESLLIINDEAHIGVSTKLLKQLPDALLIGFTATPDWKAGKHLPEIYKSCVVGAQVDDLIQSEFLTPYKHFARIGADINVLEIKNGEFTEQSQEQAFGNTAVYKGVIDDLQNVPYKKALIFCASIKHCKDVATELEYNGFTVVEVHSQVENASYNLGQFTHGKVNICVSVGILTKGFDFSQIDLICLIRAISSLPLFLQCVGRGSRLHPGKLFFTVLDYGENYKRHGLWDADREWEKLWLPQNTRKESEKLGVAPVKMCEQCQAIIPVSAIVCPFCAEMQPAKEKEMQDGELIEVTEKYNQLRGRRISELSPVELATFAKLKNKRAWAIRVAKAKDKQEPGFLDAFGKNMNYKNGWANYQKVADDQQIEFYDLILK